MYEGGVNELTKRRYPKCHHLLHHLRSPWTLSRGSRSVLDRLALDIYVVPYSFFFPSFAALPFSPSCPFAFDETALFTGAGMNCSTF